ncbi:MAG TPA: hypothetical protein VGR52_00370 [Stellaceae bacterium]|nr:hypothetical protein [Stellaceae bacterium]
MVEISDEERQSFRQAGAARADAFEAATKKVSREEALELMLSPRGQAVMARFLAIAFWAHEGLPDHRQTPSDAAMVATIFLNLFPGLALLELGQVFEHEAIDLHLRGWSWGRSSST